MQLERRVAFRRAMKKAVARLDEAGRQGDQDPAPAGSAAPKCRAREWYREGRVPLHTLRADIDYGFAEAKTTYGVIGVKVWIFKGEVLPQGADSARHQRIGEREPCSPPRRSSTASS